MTTVRKIASSYCKPTYELINDKCYGECNGVEICADNKTHCCTKSSNHIDLGERETKDKICPDNYELNGSTCYEMCPFNAITEGNNCVILFDMPEPEPAPKNVTIYDKFNNFIKKNIIVTSIVVILMCLCCCSFIVIMIFIK